MDVQWMKAKLQEFADLAQEYYEALYGLRDLRVVDLSTWELYEALTAREATIKRILRKLDPALAEFDVIFGPDSTTAARNAVSRARVGIGALNDREEWVRRLAPDSPVLPADRLHDWVWGAARTLWESSHRRLAVQAAATAINAQAQTKLGRRAVSDDKLMQEAFSPNDPERGRPRLRCPGDPADPTIQSRQRGALQFAVGCFGAIRNPATHEHREWDEEEAFESMAALSILARWIDSWQVVTAS